MTEFEKALKIAKLSLELIDKLDDSWARETMIKEGPRTYWRKETMSDKNKLLLKEHKEKVKEIEEQYEKEAE